MYLMNLADDLLHKIESYVDDEDLGNWRLVFRFAWQARHVKRIALTQLSKRIPAKKRQLCVMCCHHAITEIEWTGGFKREYIPWCPLHADPSILNDVEIYCLGGLDVNGRFLLY